MHVVLLKHVAASVIAYGHELSRENKYIGFIN